MKILCSKCGKVFDSVILDKSEAWKQVYTKFVVHVGERHRQNAELLAQGIKNVCVSATAFITIDEFAVVPEEEDWIREHLGNMQEIIMMAAGFDAEEEEEETEEEVDSEVIDKVEEIPIKEDEKPLAS